MRWRLGLGLTLLGTLIGVGAHADRIDGDSCRVDGAHLAIEGPSITTPGGTTLSGDYRRHSFHYVAPAGETGAGGAVDLILLNENTVQSRVGGAAPATWTRCTPPVSVVQSLPTIG